jgi:hypothetical protein
VTYREKYRSFVGLSGHISSRETNSVSFLVPRIPSKFGLIHKHIVKHIVAGIDANISWNISMPGDPRPALFASDFVISECSDPSKC